ncbi:MAG: hypothetical protein A3K60_06260 [Euryarchaeota archaeon RBG_19FT_COMBO_56_21]|nr:MAG: hypothetical protein A3K60_06260 [Euryarchaeota archaeon RBG_19FT_COMBO_56_21]
MTRRGEIAVYAGQGSSHSWTWLADLFEAKGVNDVRFLDAREFVPHLGAGTDCAIVSGGDGFRIAESLSGNGFRTLRKFIEGGGMYVGICAGAYLPLPSKLGPFSEFNLSRTRIENIDQRIHDLSGVPTRVAVPYGSCSIVHPVRGEVVVEWDGKELLAPIYGGPIFKEPDEDQVLARYRGFTEKTEFQMSRVLAQNVVIDKVASVKCSFGNGALILIGPHLEHPSYPDANDLFLRTLDVNGRVEVPRGGVVDYLALDKAVADLKVAIVGLENRSFVVGKKLWDGSRYMELVRAIENRTWTMGVDLAEEIATSLWRVREDLKAMKVGVETDADASTELLVESTRACVDNHFQALARGR